MFLPVPEAIAYYSKQYAFVVTFSNFIISAGILRTHQSATSMIAKQIVLIYLWLDLVSKVHPSTLQGLRELIRPWPFYITLLEAIFTPKPVTEILWFDFGIANS